MSLSLHGRATALLFFCAVLALPVLAADKDFVVNLATDQPDADLADGVCDINPAEEDQGQCTLRAAIEQANAEVPTTLHNISFSVSKVTLSNASALPDLVQPTVIDGGDGETRVEIDGGGRKCFGATSSPAASGDPNLLIPQANNSRFENLIVYNCSGVAAFNLTGHGFVVYNNYIGTDATGNAAAGSVNTGSGISFSAELADGAIPNNPLPLPEELTSIGAIVSFLALAAPNLPPTGIIGNVISGNAAHGIEIHGTYASTAIVFDNKIGVGADGSTPIGNGTSGGSSEHGVAVQAGAYLNFIGIDNVIAANDVDSASAGVFIETGRVPFPNFVAGNHIGVSPTDYLSDRGNSLLGIQVTEARPTTAGDPIDNPTDLSVVIGPGNIVGFNGLGECGLTDTPSDIECVQGGIAVTNSNTDGVRIWGNIVGISDPSSIVNIGNHGDGINVVGTNIEIGGSTLVEGNVIGRNERHGLVIRGGASTNNVTAHANYIGVTPLDGDVRNAGNGIWLRGSGTQIGGTAYANERNVIANNDMHAIKLGGEGSAFGNLIQQNEIYNVAAGFLAIDLDETVNGIDDADNDPVVDRAGSAINAANWEQNTVTLTSTGGAGTTWELRSAATTDYRIDFYSAPDEGDAKTWLCEVLTTTNGDDGFGGGFASGIASCAAAGPGLWITATVTDISPGGGDVPERPGFPAGSDINNTSEFSNAVVTPDQVTFSSATYTGTENGGSIIVTLQRVGTGNAEGVTVNVVDLLSGTATSGVDYTIATGNPISWPGLDSTDKTVTINLVNDAIFEAPETIDLQLQGPSGAEVGTIDAPTVTINDDGDAMPSFSIDDAAGTEVSSPQITFTVTKSGATGLSATVNYAVLANTATAADYSGTLAGTLTFLPGDVTKTIVIDITDDAIFEGQEQFTVALSAPSNATISDANGIGSINDNDTPTITISDVSLPEGNAGTTPFSFTVTLSNETASNISVNWATAANTATAGSDYTTASGTLTFLAAAPLTQNVVVNVLGDTGPESDETFFVNLTDATAGSITDGQGLGTIENDDAAPTEISIADAVATEGMDGSIVFTLARAGDTSAASSVEYEVTPGMAGTPGDYVANDPLTGTVNFAIGEETASITLDIVDDAINEATETFTIELSNAVNALIVDPSGTGTITDDDAVTISISDVTQAEGTGGTTSFDFTVSLSIPSEQIIQVGYLTADDTASAAGADYADGAGTVTFNPLDTAVTISVTVTGDAAVEPDETFFVNLSNASAGSIADAQGVGTIQNDDFVSSLAIDDPVATEGTNPSIVFTITRSGDTSVEATVEFAVTPGSATTPSDYSGTLAGTLTFPVGVTTQTISLALVDDLTFEPAETLSVTLSNPVAVTIVDGAAVGTISDDDPQPTMSIDVVSQLEGNAGTSNFTFTVTLSNPSSTTVTVDFATANGTADAADYLASSGSLEFAPGVTAQTIDVVVNGDLVDEPDDTFFVNLTNATGATLVTPIGPGTIQNDDSPTPTFTVNNVTMNEGDSGTTVFDFTVTLAPLSGVETSVDVATSDISAIDAVDYAANAQTLTFPAGTSAQTFSVQVNGDSTFEPTETFSVTLSNATGGATTSGSGIGTITNDDAQPTISIGDASLVEGDAGTTNMTFVVSLSSASSEPISVDWATADGTASTAFGDYSDSAGSVAFAPGETLKNVVVAIVGDLLDEDDETFVVNLSNATNATLADASGTGTIIDDEGAPTLAINDPAATEGEPTITFTVTRSGDTSGDSSVDYAVNAGTATTPDDYTASALNLRTPAVQTDGARPGQVIGHSALSGTLLFAAGETTKSITLDIVDDATFEQPETFTVTLSNPLGATISDGSATATLADDDPQPTISIGDVSANEGDAGVTTFTFTVTLSNPSSLVITVDFATADGTATVAGLDYMAANGTLTFAPGVVTQTISVTVDGDVTEEPNETFTVNLTNPTNATIVDAQSTGTIVDDDAVVAEVANVPALGAKELMLLASLLAAVALMVMRKM